jgi:hypothetical protein
MRHSTRGSGPRTSSSRSNDPQVSAGWQRCRGDVTDRRTGLLVVVVGTLLIAAAQRLAPIGSPALYDGVVVQDPYRYLAPGPGQAGSPTSYSGSLPIVSGSSPAIAAATTETPPQAQLVVGPGAVLVTPGTTALTATIEPVAPGLPPPTIPIAGNAYRFGLTNQAGAPLAFRSGSTATVVLRAPGGTGEALVARYTGSGWVTLPTESGAQPGVWIANTTALGDFALVAPLSPGLDPRFVAATVVAAAVSVAVLGFVILRQGRRPQRAAAPPSPKPARSTGKRRTKRRRR